MGPSFNHVGIALLMQLAVGALYGWLGAGVLTPWIGAGVATAWALGREFAQSFRHSAPTRINVEPSKFLRQAGWPALVTHAAALALTVAVG